MKNNPSTTAIEFKETQRFTQIWLWVLLILIMLTLLLGIYNQIINDEPYGNNPMSDAGLIALTVFFFGIVVLFFTIRLTTHLTKTMVHMRFSPFISKAIPWEDIQEAIVINYGFVGGWGIRFGSSYGTVYNIKGRKGLTIKLKNEDKFIIGTQKPEELKAFLSTLT